MLGPRTNEIWGARPNSYEISNSIFPWAVNDLEVRHRPLKGRQYHSGFRFHNRFLPFRACELTGLPPSTPKE
jgi:hypothetical protein